MMGLVVAILLVCAGFVLCAVLLLANMAESLERIADAAEAAAVDRARALGVDRSEGRPAPAQRPLDAWGSE